ncbi:MAG: hypothetical protein CMH30_07595 [Micavibrio sp.]|nr:hypothetical protein [Micavibrio sp.]|tara:strand:- start:1564 stop:1953 length:390 start_codon:yes stop_codon:yes gene_type:complete
MEKIEENKMREKILVGVVLMENRIFYEQSFKDEIIDNYTRDALAQGYAKVCLKPLVFGVGLPILAGLLREFIAMYEISEGYDFDFVELHCPIIGNLQAEFVEDFYKKFNKVSDSKFFEDTAQAHYYNSL